MSVEEVTATNPLKLLRESFHLPDTVLTSFYLIHQSYNPAFENFMALSIWNGSQLLLLIFSIGLPHSIRGVLI